jgi:putative hydrolase of the HAD superfamily
VRRRQPTALLIDLDGVVRSWDPAVNATVEAEYGLPAGALTDTALAWRTLTPAICGVVSHDHWMAEVAAQLAESAGGIEHARAAVARWQAYRGEVVPEALALVRAARTAGRPVALATNATDRLGSDLALLGLTDEFDAIVNSSEVGIHKPAREYFAAACAALGAEPSTTLLVDDSDRCVRGARAAGLSAYRWTGPEGIPYVKAALGVA